MTTHGSTSNLRLHDGAPGRMGNAKTLHAIYACVSCAVRFRFVRPRVGTEVQGLNFTHQNAIVAQAARRRLRVHRSRRSCSQGGEREGASVGNGDDCPGDAFLGRRVERSVSGRRGSQDDRATGYRSQH